MAYYNPRFHGAEFSGYQASDSILEAIEDLANHEFDDEDEDCPARRIWDNPTPQERVAVITAAWRYENDLDVTELHWGIETIYRNDTPRRIAMSPHDLPVEFR